MKSKRLFLSIVASSLVVSFASADSVWIDNSVNTHPQDSVKIGKSGYVGASEAIAIGSHADAHSDYSTSVGRYSQSAERGTAIGGDSAATADASTAVGVNAKASAENSVALGTDSSANAKNSVALGFNSVANEINTVSVGSRTNKRRVTNVADGINDYDAVNVKQLHNVRDEARAGIASALSLAPAALPDIGKTSLNLGVGTFAGESALSVNVNHRLLTGHGTDVTVGFGVSGNTNEDIAGRANIGINF